MRVYFAADPHADEKFQQRFSAVVDGLHSLGVIVMSNLVQKNVSGFSSQDLERIDQAGEVLLEKMDGLIVEGSRPFPESGYLIALALAHKKPILYLTEKNRPINKNLLHIQKEKTTGALLQLRPYTDATLLKMVGEFIDHSESGDRRELPSIKFTLRITKRIERYLQWKTHNTKLTKADYLRALIEDLIANDENYQRFLRRDQS